MEADGNEMTDACSDFSQAWARAGSSLALKDMTGFQHMIVEQRGSSRRSHKGLVGGEGEAEVPIVGGEGLVAVLYGGSCALPGRKHPAGIAR